jgi:peptide/nickel transport system permease protein
VLRFVIRRLLWMVPTILVVTFLVYLAVRIGWNPLAAYDRANPRASDAKRQQFLDVNGLYPGFSGYVRGYFQWAGSFLRGPDHWPRAIKGRSVVWTPLRYAIFNTIRLAGLATLVGIIIGLSLGIWAARRPGKLVDTIVNSGAFFVGSIPPFVSGVALQLVFAVSLGWLPTGGVYPPGHSGFDLGLMSKHLILPVSVVAVQIIAQYSRYMRATLLDVKSSDYMRTARAKGISDFRVLMRHGVRNALLPVVTLLGIDIGAILGGLIITEAIFGYPGLGEFFLNAQTNGDFPQLMPYMVLIVASVLFFNLLADLCYAALDPRILLD